MTISTINSNDPRLTAYVLGELSAEEAAEIQTALEQNPELHSEAESIRQVVAQIETAMKEEDGRRQTADGSREPATQSPKRRRWFLPAAITAIAASLIIALLLPQITKEPDRANHELSQGDFLFEHRFHSESLEKNQTATKREIDDARSSEDAESSQEHDHFYLQGAIAQWSQPLIDPSEPAASAPARSAQPTPLGTSERMGSTRGGKSASMGTGTAGMGMGMSMGGMGGGGRSAQNKEIMSFGAEMLSESQKRPSQELDRDGVDHFYRPSYNRERNEAYKDFTENDFQPVRLGEFSTFSIDVDTASYTVMRRFVNDMNQRPPADSVRLEEYINYFNYEYAAPADGKPFATHVDVFPCPWQPDHLLARIGIKGKEYSVDERPPLNLVFLVDVSGSMESTNRLPLVQRGLTELVEMLQPKDRVAIVTYAGSTQVVLPSVSGQEKRAILDSINALQAGGSTAGASGIKLAYETARRYYDKEAQNRVILCTDGDFNVGTTDNKTLEEMIGDEAKSGVFLTILGFGMGNYKDDRLKTLSMRGNGNYGYIDSIEECRKLLVEGLTGTLFTIAKDVKIQVDFNPAKVSGYRLLGYENRKLRDEDFHNDAVDAGDIGAGHTVTALYEIVPMGVKLPTAVDRSRYDATEPVALARESLSYDTGSVNVDSVNIDSANPSDEFMLVKLRYKAPDGDKSSLLEYPVKATVGEANGDSQFASAVALYGMLLRSSRHSGNGSWSNVLELAAPNTKEDKYREEFVELVKKVQELR